MQRSRKATIRVTEGKEVVFTNSILVRGRAKRSVMSELKELAGYGGHRARKVYDDESIALYKVFGAGDVFFEIEYAWLYRNSR